MSVSVQEVLNYRVPDPPTGPDLAYEFKLRCAPFVDLTEWAGGVELGGGGRCSFCRRPFSAVGGLAVPFFEKGGVSRDNFTDLDLFHLGGDRLCPPCAAALGFSLPQANPRVNHKTGKIGKARSKNKSFLYVWRDGGVTGYSEWDGSWWDVDLEGADAYTAGIVRNVKKYALVRTRASFDPGRFEVAFFDVPDGKPRIGEVLLTVPRAVVERARDRIRDEITAFGTSDALGDQKEINRRFAAQCGFLGGLGVPGPLVDLARWAWSRALKENPTHKLGARRGEDGAA